MHEGTKINVTKLANGYLVSTETPNGGITMKQSAGFDGMTRILRDVFNEPFPEFSDTDLTKPPLQVQLERTQKANEWLSGQVGTLSDKVAQLNKQFLEVYEDYVYRKKRNASAAQSKAKSRTKAKGKK